MKIEIKKTEKPVDYGEAIRFLEQRVDKIHKKEEKELIWILKHRSIYTAGTSYRESEILDKSVKLCITNRGGKITYHGPGQLICYFVINLSKRKKDIRNFLNIIENTIIDVLKDYKIKAFADRKNIGIWVKNKKKNKKLGAIGIRIKKWIAYHGFSININTDLDKYKKIIPCGLKNSNVTNLYTVKKQSYNNLDKKIVKELIKNLKI